MLTDLSEVFVAHENPAPVDAFTKATLKEVQDVEQPVEAAGKQRQLR